jgi:hypothetical protein
MVVINSNAFKRLHNIPITQSLSVKEIAKLSGMPYRALMEVYSKGLGAFHTNSASVRPQVHSSHQWAVARIYSFVMKRKGTFHGVDNHIAVKYGIDGA